LNAVPLLMPKPYLVTIHDMSTLPVCEPTRVSQPIAAYYLRRGLLRADRVLAVSMATCGRGDGAGNSRQPDARRVQRARSDFHAPLRHRESPATADAFGYPPFSG